MSMSFSFKKKKKQCPCPVDIISEPNGLGSVSIFSSVLWIQQCPCPLFYTTMSMSYVFQGTFKKFQRGI